MDGQNINIELTPESRDLLKRLGDVDFTRLRDTLERIGDDFRQNMGLRFEGNGVTGARRWADLADTTKKQKQRLYGRVYPIMVASGKLAASFYSKAAEGNINRVGETSAEFGSGIRYASFHEYGTKNMPQRQLIAQDDRQILRWRRIINNYFQKLFQRNGIKVEGDIV